VVGSPSQNTAQNLDVVLALTLPSVPKRVGPGIILCLSSTMSLGLGQYCPYETLSTLSLSFVLLPLSIHQVIGYLHSCW
jgi:hypothetical protein